MNVSHTLAPIHATDLEGRRVRLGTLWEDAPAVLVFLRYFGWIFCKMQLAQLRGIVEEVEALGARVVLIGNGTPEQGKEYSSSQEVPFRLLVDPELNGYQAMELKRNLLSGMTPRSPFRFLKALRRGFRSGDIGGDPYQLGGVFVVAPGGEIHFSHIARELGDDPRMSDILEALARIRDRD